MSAEIETLRCRPATESDVTHVLALWDPAAENDARSADGRGAVLALLSRDPDALDPAVLDGRLVVSLISVGMDGAERVAAAD
ncbi:hypothetical protein ACU6RU_02235 [Microbacterium sp. F1-18]